MHTVKRNDVIQIRVSPNEKAEIERRAESDVATFLRSLALGPIWAVSQLLQAKKTEPEWWEVEDLGLDHGDAGSASSQPKGPVVPEPGPPKPAVSVIPILDKRERLGLDDPDRRAEVAQAAAEASEPRPYDNPGRMNETSEKLFELRVDELAKTMPRSAARKVATKERQRNG